MIYDLEANVTCSISDSMTFVLRVGLFNYLGIQVFFSFSPQLNGDATVMSEEEGMR